MCPAGGDLGGCSALRSSVEAAEAKPRLWLCGHIHEGRGAARVRFGERLRSARPRSGGGAAPLPAAEATLRERRGAEGGAGAAAPESTVVVNAASANSGMAKRLLHGATVVTLLT